VTTITGKQELDKNVIANASTYTFIVEPGKTTYEVVDTVTYVGGGSGSSTLTFSITAPTGSLSVASTGTEGYYAEGTQEVVGLKTFIILDATSSTNANTAGSFMFMQILNTTYTEFTVPNGTSQYRKNDWDRTNEVPPGENFNGKLLDDGNPIGYPFQYHGAAGGGSGGGDDDEYFNGWVMPALSIMPTATSGTPRMGDAPDFASARTNIVLTIAETFSTYLMYKPTLSGVWIALSEIDWGTSVTATNPAGIWTGPADQNITPSAPITPSGDALFPTWVNTSTNFLDPNKNPFRNGHPGP
jgi:hypothetical protein